METYSDLRAAALSNEWTAIYPELSVGILALALLALEIVLPRRLHPVIPRFAVWGQVGIALGVIVQFGSPYLGEETFSGLLVHSPYGQLMRLFFLISSILVCYLAGVSFRGRQVPRVEFYHILLVVTGAMMLLAQSNHFVMLFVALETITVGLYILVSYFRASALTLEAGLKYLIMGALSSALLLFGIVLLYGAAGAPNLEGYALNPLHFPSLNHFLAANPDLLWGRVGAALVLVGIAFKIGAVPFQIWIPDVYQGAPTPVTAFLGVASKAAGFAILLPLVKGPFAPLPGVVVPILSVMAALSILFGNVAALPQHNVKRLMGLSGVSHAGYLLLGVVAALYVPWAEAAVYFYLFTYLLGSLCVFGVMAHVAGEDDTVQELEDYAELARQQPFLGGVLAVGVASLAGIPPLAGFIGKLLIFVAAFQAGLYWLLGIGVVGVIISIYYYFGWIKAAFFFTWRDPEAPEKRAVRQPLTLLGGLTLGALAAATILLGFFQGPLSQWMTRY